MNVEEFYQHFDKSLNNPKELQNKSEKAFNINKLRTLH